MIRRKSDVLDLKEPRIIPVWIDDMEADQARAYRQAVKEMGIELTAGNILDIGTDDARVIRLCQLVETLATVDPDNDSSAKLDICVEKAHQHYMQGETHQVAFTQFQPTVERLTARLRSENIPAWEHHGGMSERDQQAAEDNWRAEGGVFVATQKSAGVGLTLTEARVMHTISKPWTPTAYEQQWKRVWRRGQKRAVFLYEYLLEGTIDVAKEKVLDRKQDMSDTVIDGHKPLEDT